MRDPHERSPPMKIALAGAGMISWYHLMAWRKLGNGVSIVALCDPDRSHAAKRADEFRVPRTYDDAEAMFAAEALDAIDIASPRETHARWVESAAARGMGILCQKPLTPTLGEAEALLARVPRTVRLMVHENWRFRPWYRKLHRWIADGELGEIRYAQLSMVDSGLLPDTSGRRPALQRQPFMANEARLMIAEGLIHHLDVVRFLCGSLRVVSAHAAHTLPDIKGETLATILLETAAGAPVIVGGTMAAPGFPPSAEDRLEMIGSKASVVLADAELRLLGPRPRVERFDPADGYQASFDGAIAHFVHCLATGASFETDVTDNLDTLRLVEHAYWAAGLHASCEDMTRKTS